MMPSPAFGMGASAQRPFVTWGLGSLSRIFGAWRGFGELVANAVINQLRVRIEP